MTKTFSRILSGLALALLLASTGGVVQAQSKAPQKQQQPVPAKVTDPVCGMQVEPAKAAGKSEYKGQTYYFCSDYCKRRFDAAPESFLKKPAPKK
jgi:Cu+-exporting ATPase